MKRGLRGFLPRITTHRKHIQRRLNLCWSQKEKRQCQKYQTLQSRLTLLYTDVNLGCVTSSRSGSEA